MFCFDFDQIRIPNEHLNFERTKNELDFRGLNFRPYKNILNFYQENV